MLEEMLKSADEIGVVLEFACDDLRAGKFDRALLVDRVDVFLDRLNERRLSADAPADREALRVEDILQVENLNGNASREEIETLEGDGIILIDGIEEHDAIDLLDRQIFALGEVLTEVGDAALHAEEFLPSGFAVEIGDGERNFAGREMSAAMDFMILDECAADCRAEDENEAVTDVGECSYGGFCESGAFGIVFDGDFEWNNFFNGVDDAEADVVFEGAAGDADAVFGIDDARQRHGDALSIRVELMNVDDGVNEIRAVGHGRRDFAALNDLGVFIHKSVFDKSAADIDDSNEHDKNSFRKKKSDRMEQPDRTIKLCIMSVEE